MMRCNHALLSALGNIYLCIFMNDALMMGLKPLTNLRILGPRKPPLYRVLELVRVEVILGVLGLAHRAQRGLAFAPPVQRQGLVILQGFALAGKRKLAN